MNKKWFINMVVSVPVFYAAVNPLVNWGNRLMTWSDFLLKTSRPEGIIEGIALMGVFLAVAFLGCVALCAAFVAVMGIFYSIIFGGGLLWRRLDKGDVLRNADGSVFKEFKEMEFIGWFNPMLRGRKREIGGL